ncbi:hypothetical protein B0H13DRAFT_1975076 [Mycena leptocephala]|nr:hypothetical protein B0H13DRAFT_1975076 [Mycena leptocephala]
MRPYGSIHQIQCIIKRASRNPTKSDFPASRHTVSLAAHAWRTLRGNSQRQERHVRTRAAHTNVSATHKTHPVGRMVWCARARENTRVPVGVALSEDSLLPAHRGQLSPCAVRAASGTLVSLSRRRRCRAGAFPLVVAPSDGRPRQPMLVPDESGDVLWRGFQEWAWLAQTMHPSLSPAHAYPCIGIFLSDDVVWGSSNPDKKGYSSHQIYRYS